MNICEAWNGKSYRIPPKGYLFYFEAVKKFGYSYRTIKHHVCKGLFKGGNGLVSEASILKYLKTPYRGAQYRKAA